MQRLSRFSLAATGLFAGVVLLFALAHAASDRAMPGDMLYAVKLRILEPIVGAIRLTPMAKAQWEGERALRRLEEAEKLAAVAALDGMKQEVLMRNMTEHLTQAERHAGDLSAQGDPEGATSLLDDLETSLGAHAAVLRVIRQIQPQESGEYTAVGGFLDSVQEAEEEISVSRERHERTVAETQGSDAALASAKIEQTERRLNEALALFRESDGLPHAAMREAAAKISFADRMLSYARTYERNGKEEDALALARTAYKSVEEAHVLLRMQAGGLTASGTVSLPGGEDDAMTASGASVSPSAISAERVTESIRMTDEGLQDARAVWMRYGGTADPMETDEARRLFTESEDALQLARGLLDRGETDEAYRQVQRAQQTLWHVGQMQYPPSSATEDNSPYGENGPDPSDGNG
ncbi:MAG: hypothetical protein PHW10_01425 [Candidatus Peribacteraceae bacterium]|nr:hypothetical protein [Candidatus Peribacteraceae bacterium]